MLKIFGLPVSSPSNKVRYVANYLNLPYEFIQVNLGTGDHQKPEFKHINPYGKVPAISDDGFNLAESNTIIRYLADKTQSPIYPRDLKQRAVIDQWIDFSSHHIMPALSRIMYNTYFYKMAGVEKDERSLQDGRKFTNQYLPVVDEQLSHQAYITGNVMTLADLAMLAALDVCEVCQVDLAPYQNIVRWRTKLMGEKFYQACHKDFTTAFNELLQRATA